MICREGNVVAGDTNRNIGGLAPGFYGQKHTRGPCESISKRVVAVMSECG
jgi:hypothetical protein